jgi:hypothetical protein
MEKLNILEKWHTFKFREQVFKCCSTLSIAVCSLAYWQNKYLVQSVFSTGRSKLKIQEREYYTSSLKLMRKVKDMK